MQALREVETVLSMRDYTNEAWKPKVISTVANEGKGVEELASSNLEHHACINQSVGAERILFQRVEYELGLVFKTELERLVFQGLKGTGKKKNIFRKFWMDKMISIQSSTKNSRTS